MFKKVPFYSLTYLLNERQILKVKKRHILMRLNQLDIQIKQTLEMKKRNRRVENIEDKNFPFLL